MGIPPARITLNFFEINVSLPRTYVYTYITSNHFDCKNIFQLPLLLSHEILQAYIPQGDKTPFKLLKLCSRTVSLSVHEIPHDVSHETIEANSREKNY